MMRLRPYQQGLRTALLLSHTGPSDSSPLKITLAQWLICTEQRALFVFALSVASFLRPLWSLLSKIASPAPASKQGSTLFFFSCCPRRCCICRASCLSFIRSKTVFSPCTTHYMHLPAFGGPPPPPPPPPPTQSCRAFSTYIRLPPTPFPSFQAVALVVDSSSTHETGSLV